MSRGSYSGDHPSGEPAPDSESQKMSEEKKGWLDDLPPLKERILEPQQLPTWAKLAITKYELGYYDTIAEAADAHDRARGTFANWRATPGGRKYIEGVREIRDDPAKMAETMLRGHLHSFTMDFMEMFQAAYEAGDFSEVRKMWESVNDRVPGGLSKKGDLDVGEATIQISFGAPEDLEPVEVESDHERIEEADYEVVEDEDAD